MKVIILPGLDGTEALRSGLVLQLSDQFDVSTLQYPSNLTSYSQLLAWTEAQLPKSNFVIVAESFSGPLAVFIASKAKRNLKGVFFAATFAKSPRKVPSFLPALFYLLPVRLRQFSSLVQPILMGQWANKEFTTMFHETILSVPKSTIVGRLREVLKVDVVELLAGLNVPAKFLLPTNDRIVPSRMAADFDISPNAVIKTAGPHFVLQARPVECARQISEFINQLE